jgi:hypothetical protein
MLGKSLGKKLLEKGEDAALAPLYAQLLPNEKLQRANREFVNCFTKELDKTIILPTLNAPQYAEALGAFLCNPTVQDAIRRPLDGESEFDWALLGGIWTELKRPDGSNLMALPSAFGWSHIGSTYQNAVQKLIPSTPDMRKLLAALGRLAPPSEPIDFKRYSTELIEAYGYLRLGSIGEDWTAYGSGISLRPVYVPQGVKQALPPRVLTRDYLRTLTEETRAITRLTSSPTEPILALCNCWSA